jgi:hypothetical protein
MQWLRSQILFVQTQFAYRCDDKFYFRYSLSDKHSLTANVMQREAAKVLCKANSIEVFRDINMLNITRSNSLLYRFVF